MADVQPMICPQCGSGVERVDGGPERNAEMLLRCQPCGDVVTLHEAAGLRVPIRIEPLNAATLVTRERTRQIVEEGFTPAWDAKLKPGDLPWMAWSLMDRAEGGRNLNEPPTAWPVDPARWPMNKNPLRLWVIAAAMAMAEIERRLGNGERP